MMTTTKEFIQDEILRELLYDSEADLEKALPKAMPSLQNIPLNFRQNTRRPNVTITLWNYCVRLRRIATLHIGLLRH
jgi:hypothetical protein